jgi:hypothetical protein
MTPVVKKKLEIYIKVWNIHSTGKHCSILFYAELTTFGLTLLPQIGD